MKQYNIFRFLMVSIMGALIPYIAFAAPVPDEYLYEKRVMIPTAGTVIIPFDQQINDVVPEKANTIALFDNTQTMVDWVLYERDITPISPSLVQLTKTENITAQSPQTLLDQDVQTVFDAGTGTIDKPATFIITFTEPRAVSEIMIDAGPDAQIRTMGVLYRDEAGVMRPVFRKKPWQRTMTTPIPRTIQIEIQLTGRAMKIKDLFIRTAPERFMIADITTPGLHTVAYGRVKPYSTYVGRGVRNTMPDAPYYTLKSQRFNTGAYEDLDNDGVMNTDDNCPLAMNNAQKDQDEDGIGDACDNAPKSKNRSQRDTDLDGVGDTDDNCISYKNPNQEDKDNDGIGDACDLTYDQQSVIKAAEKITDKAKNAARHMSQSERVMLYILVLLILMSLAGAVRWTALKRRDINNTKP